MNTISYDLVTECGMGFLEVLERQIDSTNIHTAIQLFITLTEYCQGIVEKLFALVSFFFFFIINYCPW
jgi:hypothetical protein